MFIIGELINSTRKPIRAAVESRDAAYIASVARRQAVAGASMLDVNGGIPGRERECLVWLVNVVQDAVDLPLCLDTADPDALTAALPLCRRPAMVNSIPDEPLRFDATLPLVKDHGAKVIAMCVGTAGPPSGIDDRVDAAARLVDRLTAEGVALADIYVDPCILPVSTGPEQGSFAAEAIARIMRRYPGVHTSVGLSNVSFGLPVRRLLNQSFAMLLIARGLDAAIADPCDRQRMANIIAAETLLGRDPYCMNYIRAFRQGKLQTGAAPVPAAVTP